MPGRLYAALASLPPLESLPPSPDWADFWGSLIEGSIAASMIWLVDRHVTRLTALQIFIWSWVHTISFGFAIHEGLSDGWSTSSMAEISGRAIVLLGFIAAMYATYHREGGRWNRRPTRSQQAGDQLEGKIDTA